MEPLDLYEKECCMKACKKTHSSSSFIDYSNSAELPKGCYYNSSTNNCGYSGYSKLNDPDITSQGYTQININECLNSKIKTVVHKKNELEETNIFQNSKNSDKYTSGLMVGSMISILICVGLYFMAKFNLFGIMYTQIKILINEHFPLFVLIIVTSFIIGTIIFFIFWKVKGYGIKSHRHIGYYKLYNRLYKSNGEDDSNKHIITVLPYKLGNRTTINESYLFKLKIDEQNKESPNNESNIFSVIKSNNKNLNNSTKDDIHLSVSLLNHENILQIRSNTINDDDIIKIDNIPFEEEIFLGIIFNKQSIEIYINGRLIKSKLYNIKKEVDPISHYILLNINKSLYKGSNIIGSIDGSIDLTMYDKPLSHKEVMQHYITIIKIGENYVSYMYSLFVAFLSLPKKLLFGDKSGLSTKQKCNYK